MITFQITKKSQVNKIHNFYLNYFFRYVPTEDPQIISFHKDGIFVDVSIQILKSNEAFRFKYRQRQKNIQIAFA